MGAFVTTDRDLERVQHTATVGNRRNRVKLSVAISDEFQGRYVFLIGDEKRKVGHLGLESGCKLSLYFDPSKLETIPIKAIALTAFVYKEMCANAGLTDAEVGCEIVHEIKLYNTPMQRIMLSLLLICRDIKATQTDQLTGNGMSTIEASDVVYKIPSCVVQQWVMHLHSQMENYFTHQRGKETALWSPFKFSGLESDVRHSEDFADNLNYLLDVAGKPALQVYFFQTALRDRINYEIRSAGQSDSVFAISAPPQINTEHFEATASLGPQRLFQENINSSTECTFAAKKLSPKERRERNLDDPGTNDMYEVTMTPSSASAMPADLPRCTNVITNAARTRQTAAWPVMGAPIVPPLQSVVVGHPVKEPIRPPLSGNPQQVCPIGPKAHAKGDVQLKQNARPLNPPSCARTDVFTRTMQGKHSVLGKIPPCKMPIDEELAKHIKEALPEVDASRVYEYCEKLLQKQNVKRVADLIHLSYRDLVGIGLPEGQARRIYMATNAATEIVEGLAHHIREALGEETGIDEATAHFYCLLFQKELGVKSLEQLKQQQHERTSNLGIPMLHLSTIIGPQKVATDFWSP